MGYALSIGAQLDFVTMECGECGIVFAVSEHFNQKLRDTGQGWYCPNGHSRVYTETTVQKLQKQLATAKDEAERQRQARIEADRRTTVQIGVNTKLKKRIHAGVCPHCQRTVSQLAAHMKSKHPQASACSTPR